MWTPRQDQIGPFYVPFTCTDDGAPPAFAAGQLTFKVSPLDACAMPSCDPASGCVSTLPPVTQTCCSAGPVKRVAGRHVVLECVCGLALTQRQRDPMPERCAALWRRWR